MGERMKITVRRTLVRRVQSVSWHYRYMLSIGVCALLSGSWWWLIYQPLDGLIEKSSRNVHQYAQQAVQLCCAAGVCSELDQTVHNLRSECNNMLNTAQSEYEPFVYVAEIAQKCGLQLVGVNEQACVDKAWCTRKQARVEVVGDLSSISKMLYAIKTSSRMLRCTHATLARASSNQYTFISDIDASVPQATRAEAHIA